MQIWLAIFLRDNVVSVRIHISDLTHEKMVDKELKQSSVQMQAKMSPSHALLALRRKNKQDVH